MTFEDVWDSVDLETVVRVSNELPPPSSNTQGIPYKAWASHNFTGTLEEKITENGWQYLKFEVLPSDTGEQVVYLAYTIPKLGGHTFEVVE